jgi:dynein assembly factor 3
MRINSYYIPNRTLSSYIPGKTKQGKDSCLVRGFWGDITNSPFIGFGVELNNEEEHEIFYAKSDIHYKFHAQHITEWNLSRILTRLEKDELYKLKFTDHKIPKKKSDSDEDKIKNEENSNLSTEASNKEIKEENKNKIAEKDDTFNIEIDTKISLQTNSESGENETNNIKPDIINVDEEKKLTIKDQNKPNEKFSLENENNDKILLGFEYFDTKIYLVTGEVDQFFKKKK